MIKETLEEAKIKYLQKCVKEKRFTGYCDEDFENGAKWQEQKTIELMKLAFEAGFKKRDSVLAGLEAKETDIEVQWIFKKNN